MASRSTTGCMRPRGVTRLLRRPELGALAGTVLVDHHLRHRRPQDRPVHAARHHQRPADLGRARHPRHRRRAPDDRRRVRPVDRLDHRLCRHRHRRRRDRLAHPADRGGRARLRLRDPDRLRQRPPPDQDRPAILHRDARGAVHPARPHPGGDPQHHRPHADPLHRPGQRRFLAGRALRQARLPGSLPLVRRGRRDRHPPGRGAGGARACRFRSSGGWG